MIYGIPLLPEFYIYKNGCSVSIYSFSAFYRTDCNTGYEIPLYERIE